MTGFADRMSTMGRLTVTLFAGTILIAILVAPRALFASDEAFIVAADSPDLAWGPCPAFMPEGCMIGVLQGDPAEPNADVFFKLPAGKTVPSHWHTSAERMVLVAGEMEVKYDGQDAVTLKPGNYAYGPPELPHWASCNSDVDCVLFIAFEGPVNAMPVEE